LGVAGAPPPLSLRLGRDGLRALDEIARRRGISRAEATPQAIAETAERERRRTGLAAEARRLVQDEAYVREAREVAALMERCAGGDRRSRGATWCYTGRAMPTRHPRQMVTLTPERLALLDQVAAAEGRRPDLGGLLEEGARARLERLRRASESAQAARRRLAERVRTRGLDQDPEAADRVKRLGLAP
jgi:hypothetical protein